MRRASRRDYHFLYKTTCLVTKKWYIGIHSTDKIEDGYLGSGRRLHLSVKKYGKENHIREILEFFKSREELCKKEVEVVTSSLLRDELCMNLIVGGNATPTAVGKDTRERMRLAKLGKKQSPEHLAARRAGLLGHVQTEETKQKLRIIAQEQWARRKSGQVTAVGRRKK